MTTKPIYRKREFDLSKYGAFFAFGQKQLDAKLESGVKYFSCGAGLYTRQDNHEECMKAWKEHEKKEVARRKAMISKDGIIGYELDNYECFCTEDISDAVDALREYGYTEQDVLDVYNAAKNRTMPKLTTK